MAAGSLTIGTAFGGWKIVRTVGSGVYRMAPLDGLVSQGGSAAVILAGAALGAPVSTTHVVASSVVGVGMAQRPHHVRITHSRTFIPEDQPDLLVTAIGGLPCRTPNGNGVRAGQHLSAGGRLRAIKCAEMLAIDVFRRAACCAADRAGVAACGGGILGTSLRRPVIVLGWRAEPFLCSTLLASGLKYHSARDFDGVVCETFVVASEQCHVDRGGDAMLPIPIHQHCE